MNYFVLYQRGKAVKSSVLAFESDLPDVLLFDGGEFRRLDAELGDFNHLISDTGNKLIGFEFPLAQRFRKIFQNSFVKQSSNVSVDDAATLRILLCEDEAYHSDGVLALGNWIYENEKGAYILLVPEIDYWGELWSGLGFDFDSDGPTGSEQG